MRRPLSGDNAFVRNLHLFICTLHFRPVNPDVSIAEKLCLSCGMCCNGVIFADVQLQSDDQSDKLTPVGITLRRKGKVQCFTQPCVALDGCRCQVYADRPKYCREFECALLKSVLAGKTDFPAASRVVRAAQKRADKVRKLLRELGDNNETLSLSKRFQRVKKQMESTGFDEETAGTFGDLSIAVHELNMLLSEAFYPGS